ncbi:MAG: peptidoglycan-binding protein [Campylobacteraceae bacterium]|jgi:curli biogenesis system outer membrane secretion channel CsgG|nr:peptidoglycan-binding protein [Campylobacteraceae bacterium]
MLKLFIKSCVFGIVIIGLTGCIGGMQLGASSAKTTATGSASGSNAENAESGLDRCTESLGTLAIYEDTNADWYRILRYDYKLRPVTPVLRLLAQQSNCFVVVERGRAMDNMAQERALAQSGELRSTSSMGKGQMVAADFTLTPEILFSAQTKGSKAGAGGGISGLIGGIFGESKTTESSAILTLIENRSGVQVVAAEGSAKNVDYSGVVGLLGGGSSGAGGAGIGGYTNTPEGQVIVASMTDAFNNLVRAAKNYKMQTVKGGLGAGKGGLQIQKD